MSKKIQTNQKHMNQDNRIIIEKRLDSATPLSHIAEELGKDPSTIAKEVINGKWGTGEERKRRLTQAGYNYNDIQKLVDKLVK